MSEPPEAVAKRNLWPIVALLFPGAVVTDRTAFEAGPSTDGSVFIGANVDRDVSLPGIIIRARDAMGPLPGDTPFVNGLHLASRARAYLENMPASRARKSVARRLSRKEIESHLEGDLQKRGAEYLQRIRDDARKLAPALGLADAFALLDATIGTLMGSRNVPLESEVAAARARGKPYDERRVELFGNLHADLLRLAPTSRPDAREPGSETTLPFFEAYFSNFIEGTEFEVDEAKDIVFEGKIPVERPADAHDVLGTYRVVADRAEMVRIPVTVEELVELLRSRHARVMEGRPEKSPGAFKTKPNRAGDTLFVAPDLVRGTLGRGFELHRSLPDAFQRAVFMMFLVSEVHPFVDGNGRVARIMMNAELVAQGERRIIVPTIFRTNYLSGLKALSQGGNTQTLVRSLDFLQGYTSAIRFATYANARAELEATNAFRDPRKADEEGVRLVLPVG